MPVSQGLPAQLPLVGHPPKTLYMSKQLLWCKARANPAPLRWLSSEPSSSLVLAAWGHSHTGGTSTWAGPTSVQYLEMHLPGVLARKGRWIPPHAWSPACAREHGDTPLCPSSVPPALPCPQDPAGWNLAILAPLNTGTPSPRTAGADTHSCCLSRLSVKPHLGNGRGRQWGSITQRSRAQGSGCPIACYWHSFWGGCMPQGHIQEAATYCAGGFSFFLMPM